MIILIFLGLGLLSGGTFGGLISKISSFLVVILHKSFSFLSSSSAALPARRGLPRRTEARAQRTLDRSPFRNPLSGGGGRVFSPAP